MFFTIENRLRMVTPPQLLKTVSSATGVPLATLIDMDRWLVKAKLRTKKGRGLNAARMTTMDAARLLTAVLASPQSNQAAEAVERYSRTRPDKMRSSERLFAAAKLDDLSAIPDNLSFVDALAGLIASAAGGSLASIMANSPEDWTPSIEVFAFTRAVKGRIRLAGLPSGFTAAIEYIPAAHTKGKPSRVHAVLAEQNAGDLEQSRRVTERTILPIASLLAEENEHERERP